MSITTTEPTSERLHPVLRWAFAVAVGYMFFDVLLAVTGVGGVRALTPFGLDLEIPAATVLAAATVIVAIRIFTTLRVSVRTGRKGYTAAFLVLAVAVIGCVGVALLRLAAAIVGI